MEDGTIVLVGATTENPSFELNAALLSRSHVLVFNSLEPESLASLLKRAENLTGKLLPLEEDARASLVRRWQDRHFHPLGTLQCDRLPQGWQGLRRACAEDDL